MTSGRSGNFVFSLDGSYIRHALSVMTLNQRRRQSYGGQYGKGVDGLF